MKVADGGAEDGEGAGDDGHFQKRQPVLDAVEREPFAGPWNFAGAGAKGEGADGVEADDEESPLRSQDADDFAEDIARVFCGVQCVGGDDGVNGAGFKREFVPFGEAVAAFGGDAGAGFYRRAPEQVGVWPSELEGVKAECGAGGAVAFALLAQGDKAAEAGLKPS